MIIAISIISYILNVFLNRWLNYTLYKRDKVILPFMWFLSFFATIIFSWLIIENYFYKPNWFTGKNWNKIKKV